MQAKFDWGDPVCLALLLRQAVTAKNPNVEFYATCNPGNPKTGAADEHYIALCERVYEKDPANPNGIGRFVGYVTYRFNEVKYHSKLNTLPELSSIEVRKDDFSRFTDGKVHFCPRKVQAVEPAVFAAASTKATDPTTGAVSGAGLQAEIRREQIQKVAGKVIQMIAGTLV